METLYGLRDNIMSAEARGIITTEEARTYMDEIYVPLVAKTIKEVNPSLFQKLTQGVTGLIPAVSIFRAFHPDKADALKVASKVIEDHLKREGTSGDNSKRIQFYDQYFKAMKIYSGQNNLKTNAKWTPLEVSRLVTGENEDNIITNNLGETAKIIGYNEDGVPLLEQISGKRSTAK